MIPVNELLNRVNEWNAPEYNTFKRHVGTRLTNLYATAPTQALAVAQNILIVPFQAVGVALNAGVKVVTMINGSQAAKDFRAKLPDLTDLVRTVARIVLYAIGTALTATLGVISPETNFTVQCALGLAINQREEAIKNALIEAEMERLNQAAVQQEAERVAIKQNAAAIDELNKMMTVQEIITQKQNEAKDEAIEAAGQMFIEVEKGATSLTPSRANPAVEQEVIRDLEEVNEVEDESDVENDIDDSLIVFEQTEDTGFTRVVQGALEAGVSAVSTGYTGVQYLAGGALDTSKRILNYIANFFPSTQETA